MAAKLIEGGPIAESIREQVRRGIEALGRAPKLVGVLASDNPGAKYYAKSQQKSCALEPAKTRRCLRVKPEVRELCRRKAPTVAKLGNNDDPVAVKKYGRPQAGAGPYHFVCLRCKAGWLTRQC